MNIKISVIIPVYNSEKYLFECLDSICAQTIDSLEVICVDDGSTDNSANIISTYKGMNIKLIQQKNSGAGHARNVGLKQASGKYVSFVDPDDLYAENTILEKLYTAAESHKADVCGGNILIFYDGGSPFLTDTYSKYHVMEEGFVSASEYQNPWGHTKYIYRRDFLEATNIKYPEYRRGEDPVFMLNVLREVGYIYMIPQTVYLYRQYKQRERFMDSVIIELLDGYAETMKVAFDNNYPNAFVDCVDQIAYWYKYLGLNIINNNNFWNVVKRIESLVMSGESKWNLSNMESVQISPKIIEKNLEAFCCILLKVKEASNMKRLAVYGSGNIAKQIIPFFEELNIHINAIVVTKKTEKSICERPIIEISKLDNKDEYTYFIAVSAESLQNEIIENLSKLNCKNYLKADVETLVNMNGVLQWIKEYWIKNNLVNV